MNDADRYAHQLFALAVRLYPAEFRQRFGASMAHDFRDLVEEHERKGASIGALTARAVGGVICTAFMERWRSVRMTSLVANPQRAALVAALMAAPLALLFPIIAWEIEPLNSFATSMLTIDNHQPNVIGMTVLFGGLMLLPFALATALWPVFKARKQGIWRTMRPNLAVAAIIIALMTPTWGALAQEIVRCEIMAIPNCD